MKAAVAKILPAGVLLAAVILAAPWEITDPDTLSRLAIGRTIVDGRAVPATDPLTFSAPETRWSNPEWLGDLGLFLVHRAGGETALEALKLCVIGAGWLLVLLLSTRRGASPWIAVAVMLLFLPASATRFIARNHIHAFWLVPLYGLVVHAIWSDGRRALLYALVVLAILWANLHGSFALGWFVLAASLLRLTERAPASPDRWLLRLLVLVLLCHPLLALVSPHGLHNYGQIVDHIRGSSVYRVMIAEWQPAATGWRQLTFHLVTLFGLLTFLPRANRRQLEPFALFAGAVVLAYLSRRFVPLMAVVAGPCVAVNLTRWVTQLSPRGRVIGTTSLVLVGAVAASLAAAETRTAESVHVLRRPRSPVGAARFMQDSAPSGARLFNPYNAGPWLLWKASRARIYIDPRNNLGAGALERYIVLLRRPAELRREVDRLGVTHAMVDLSDGRFGRLNRILNADPAWSLVFLDGAFGIYARSIQANRDQLEKKRFRLLRAWQGFEYLLRPAPDPARREALGRDARQLSRQGTALASVLKAYRLLARDGAPPPRIDSGDADDARRARALLEGALPKLPPSPVWMVYLATAYGREGRWQLCRDVVALARSRVPSHPLVLVLELELARREKKHRAAQRLHGRLRKAAPPNHPVWPILARKRLVVP